MRARVSMGLSKLNITELIEFARQIVQAMTGNASFTSPVPALSQVGQIATSLELANNNPNLSNEGKKLQTEALRGQLNSLLYQLAAYIENVANGDANVINSAGMRLASLPGPSQLPDAPLHVNTQSGLAEGQVKIKWDKVKYAHVYVIEISDDTAAVNPGSTPTSQPTNSTARSFITWVQSSILTQSHVVLNGLSSGIKYAIRIYAVGAKGKGNYSVPVIVKVL